MTCDRHLGWPCSVGLSTQLDISLSSNFLQQDVGGGYKILAVCCQLLEGFGNYKGGNFKKKNLYFHQEAAPVVSEMTLGLRDKMNQSSARWLVPEWSALGPGSPQGLLFWAPW